MRWKEVLGGGLEFSFKKIWGWDWQEAVVLGSVGSVKQQRQERACHMGAEVGLSEWGWSCWVRGVSWAMRMTPPEVST